MEEEIIEKITESGYLDLTEVKLPRKKRKCDNPTCDCFGAGHEE